MGSALYNRNMQIDLKELKGKRITVALSGGGDSVALLHYLKQNKMQLSAVHIHHGIRGKEADKDADFVQNLCKAWDIPLLFKKFDVPQLARQNKMTVEEMGRRIRYQIFYELLKGETDIVVTAHHSDDNVESLLFNLFRGSAIKGICGITACYPAENGYIVRPMLAITKQEILNYLQVNNLQWREDSTNQDNKYTRNFIRNSMLKDAEQYFPQYAKRITNFCKIAKQDDDFLQELAKKELKIQNEEVSFALDLPAPIFFRASIQAMELLAGKVEYATVHLQDIYQLKELQNGKKITLPKQVVAMRVYDKIVFYLEKEQFTFKMPFELGRFQCNGRWYSLRQVEKAEFNKVKLKSKGKSFYIDGDNLQDVCIRTRQAGDRFTKFSGGSKKLKEYFVDKKIPLNRRDSIPLLARGSEILAIFGVEIAKTVKVTEQTKKIIELLEESDG